MSGSSLAPRQRALLDQRCGKWSLLVVNVLCDRSARCAEPRRALEGITPNSLRDD